MYYEIYFLFAKYLKKLILKQIYIYIETISSEYVKH